MWRTLLLKWIFPTWKSNSNFSQQQQPKKQNKKKLKPLQNSRSQKDYTKQVPSRGPTNTKFSRQGDLAAGNCETLEQFFFVEFAFALNRQNFAKLGTHIIILKVPPPLHLYFRAASNTPTMIVWNSECKVILAQNITYSPEILCGNIYSESIQISYNTLLRNVSTFSLLSCGEYHWTWKCEVCYRERPHIWTQNWSHKLISYKHGDGYTVWNYILKF